MSKYAPKPKVAAAIVAGIIASAVLANIDLITPDLFDGLGKWSHLIYGLTITLVMSAAGWLKADPTPAPQNEDGSFKITSLPASWEGDGHGLPHLDEAPAYQFPKADVDAALAAEAAVTDATPTPA